MVQDSILCTCRRAFSCCCLLSWSPVAGQNIAAAFVSYSFGVVGCIVHRSTNARSEDMQRQVVACAFLLFAVFKLKKKTQQLFKLYTVKNVGVCLNERKIK